MTPYRDHLTAMRKQGIEALLAQAKAKEPRPMLQLWEFIVPMKTNAGKSYRVERAKFERHLLDCFGGYSANVIQGGWRDVDGQDCIEVNVSYRVLCSDEPNTDILFELFPDQAAFYLARIGEGEIKTRV